MGEKRDGRSLAELKGSWSLAGTVQIAVLSTSTNRMADRGRRVAG